MISDSAIAGQGLQEQLLELINRGLITLNPWQQNLFPSARVVVPVVDSNGAATPTQQGLASTYGKLARHP